jgi:hypothetical protein
VDDIIFGGSSHSLVARFAEDMSREFEMSMMGELQFFLRFRSSRPRREHLCIKPSTRRTPQEIQDGKLQANVDTDEYNYSVGRGRGQRACGLEGVLIGSLLYLTATKAVHFSVCLCAHFQVSVGRQVDCHVFAVQS